ncbi:type VI secretion system spike protein VgrG1b [soil metagenome]
MATQLTTQTTKVYSLASPFGADLSFRSISGTEQLSRAFEYSVEATSPQADLDPYKILGQLACVSLELPSGKLRHFNGHVTEFTLLGDGGGSHGVSRFYRYRLELRPWLWFLSRNSDCRIFQMKSVPEILSAVFQHYGDALFSSQLSGSYAKKDYCVQYRETDFNFVCRLLEQEGIFFFFKHEQTKHTLVMADSATAHVPFPGFETIPFSAAQKAGVDKEVVSSWQFSRRVEPGAYALRDFEFKRPADDLLAASRTAFAHNGSDGEFYDYPGEYSTAADGKRYAKMRLEELQAPHELVDGSANVRGIVVGHEFKLKDHPRDDQNKVAWVVLACHIHGDDDTAESSAAGQGPSFSCSFQAMPAKRAFRPQRLTPKPIVQGPQTAFVVGPPGEEINVDEHGRIKVHFHWDRLGDGKDKDSCWIRVSQSWAGNAYGAMALPRIGQEVIVEFLEGDPDRPIVTGSVYNGSNRPPFKLPDEKTRWGLKSRSSPGGKAGNFNEISFEDKNGNEELYLHAEKDQTLFTKNKRTEYVGEESHLQIEKDSIEKYGADVHVDIKGDQMVKTAGGMHLTSGADLEAKVQSKIALDGGQEIHLKAGSTLILEAGTKISLKVGGNFIDISASGVSIKGSQVLVNSGGAAGSGSGAAPKKPKEATKARDSLGGTDKPIVVKPAAPKKVSPKAAALIAARASSAPFCEICAAEGK